MRNIVFTTLYAACMAFRELPFGRSVHNGINSWRGGFILKCNYFSGSIMKELLFSNINVLNTLI